MATKTGKKPPLRTQKRRNGRSAGGRKRRVLVSLLPPEEQLTAIERDWKAKNPLPFTIHCSGNLHVSSGCGGPSTIVFEWGPKWCRIARAALNGGYKLGVQVERDFVARATCRIVQTLNLPVCAGYNERLGCVLFWLLEEDQIREADDTDEGHEDQA